MEEILDQPQVRVASDEGRLPAGLELGLAGGDYARGPPEPQRLVLSLQHVLAGVLVGDHGRGHLSRYLVHQHGSRLRLGLDPRGRVHPIADDHAFAGVRLHGDLTGDDAGSRPQPGGADPLAERRYGVDDLERCPDRELRILLARPRHSPDGQHRVADELLDLASVAVEDRPGGVEIGAEQLAHVLGVAGFREAREADQVDEQHRCHPQLGSATGPGRAAAVSSPSPGVRSEERHRTRRRTAGRRGVRSRTRGI